jgi:cytosine/adenosine deaminase-related metal-dependent hydrolase
LGAGGGLLSLAMATRNPESEPDMGRIMTDITLAREIGIPVSMHAGLGFGAESAPQLLDRHGLMGPDLTFIHGNAFAAPDFNLIAGNGAWISSSPEVEMQMGLGVAPIRAMLDHRIRPTISVDVVAATGGSLPAQLRMGLQAQRLVDNQNGRKPMLSVHAVLPYVTANAAASLGMEDRIGTISPGKLADLVVIDGRSLSTFLSPPAAAVLHAHPAAVDTVLVSGRIMKRHGRLVDRVDLPGIRREASAVRRRLLDL